MNCRTSTDRVPVLIVGGSLVGLSTSLFLGRLGIGHLLVEKHAGTSTHPRGRGNNVRTMELFRDRRAWSRDPRRPRRCWRTTTASCRAGSLTGDDQEWLFKEIDPGGGLARFSPTAWCLCSQNDLEPVLLARARDAGRRPAVLHRAAVVRAGRDGGHRAVMKNREHRRAHHGPRGLSRRGRRSAQPRPRAARHRPDAATATCSTT